jgi:hypothetical protein
LLYVNGVQVTAFSTSTYPAQNANLLFNASGQIHALGAGYIGSYRDYFDGYLTEVNFIDGQALTPSSFGQTNTVTGVWQPIKYTGTYGTNGFYLNFSDNSGVTATTIGKDYSGNGNNWTPNNISVTNNSTYDSMLDVPTLFADGGNGRGNYCTLNPLVQRWSQPSSVFSNANLSITTTNASSTFGIGTISNSSGKWYYEVTVVAVGTNTPGIGVSDERVQNTVLTSEVAYLSNGQKEVAGTGTSYGATYTTNDVIGVAYDLDAATVTFYKNNTSQGAISLTVTANIFPYCSVILNANLAFNFGQRPFTYTPPTGFVALNTQNLPTPAISNGANYMAATTYTGTGATQTIANTVGSASFAPDFVWIKDRGTGSSHRLLDTVRGATLTIKSDSTAAEITESSGLTAFTSTGFTLGTTGAYNASGVAFVGWQWNGGGSTVTNTSGSISAQVRANTTAGFSVVTYTGNLSAVGTATVGHGLGVAPKMIIAKSRNVINGDTGIWVVLHTNLTNWNYALQLQATSAQVNTTANGSMSAPTSTVFSTNYTSGLNTTGNNHIAYCFSEVAGYSKFGSYTGNGSADGTFVYCGFRPRWVMIKCSSTGGAGYEWELVDTSRNTSNVTNLVLYPNLSDAEATASTAILDITSNGFKLRGAANIINASSATYIFAAFAENPFKNSLAR